MRQKPRRSRPLCGISLGVDLAQLVPLGPPLSMDLILVFAQIAILTG